MALQNRHNDIVECLLEHGADPNINPDLTREYCNRNILFYLLDTCRLEGAKLLLIYGYDPTYGCSLDHPEFYPIVRAIIGFAPKHRILQMILQNTKTIYNIKYLVKIYHARADMNIMFEHISNYGKMSTLDFLGKKMKNKINEFTKYLDSILQTRQIFSTEQLIMVYKYPLQNMTIDFQPVELFIEIKKMILFKYNLECLIGMPVPKPAHMYYDIVIVFVFLLKYQSELPTDIVKLILHKIFL